METLRSDGQSRFARQAFALPLHEPNLFFPPLRGQTSG